MSEYDLQKKLLQLSKIGIALTSSNDLNELLEQIVREARNFTSSDAGSLYIKSGKFLRFVVSQNDTLANNSKDNKEDNLFKSKVMPITEESLAGYIAATGQVLNIEDAYHIPSDKPFQFNRSFDQKTGYRTKSMLLVPMKDTEDNIIGVLQLINFMDEARNIVSFDDSDQEMIMSLASQAAVAIKNAMLTQQLKEAHYDTIFRLSVAAEYRDKDTARHIKRMSNYSAVIAQGIGLGKDAVELLLYSSPMHDVGKIGIPDAILLKPGRLTSQERGIMETHSEIGADILANSNSQVLQASEIIALSHHEKFDGTGYPNGLKGEEIPLYGRITALADVYDALASKRCYKDAMPMEKVLFIIKKDSGTHFDPDLVKVFFDNLEELQTIGEKYLEMPEPHQEPSSDTVIR